jgi:biopolymer transport protein ExbB/TolQ
MKPEWIYLFAGAAMLSLVGFLFVVVTWLCRLRDTVSAALTEAAGQQIRTAQRMNESLAQVQKQQESYNQQIHVLAQAGLRLQQELSNVTSRLDNTQSESTRGTQTLH